MSRELRPLDSLGVNRVIGDQPAADFDALRVADGDAIAARESALRSASRRPATGSCLSPAPWRRRRRYRRRPSSPASRRSRFFAPPSDWRASGTRCRAPPAPTRATGWAMRPSAITICVPADVAMRAASILVRMPPRESSEAAPPAIASISRRDALDDRDQLRLRIVLRRRVVEPGDIGQQNQQIGARHGRDARGEAVIVAVADFAGRDRIVLVDDGHGAHGAEARQRRARIEIAPPLLGVLQGQQHLARGDAVRAERLRPGARQRDLADRRRRLAVLELQRAFGEAMRRCARARSRPRRRREYRRRADAARRDRRPARRAIPVSARLCARSTSSDEPTLTTMRLNWAREGREVTGAMREGCQYE